MSSKTSSLSAITERSGTRSRRLNVGCGRDVRAGWVNLDVARLPGIDVVHDLDSFPWPFEDNAFDEIALINVLEHLPDTVRAMNELYRIVAPGGKVTIRVPYWNSPDAISDPTHKASFNEHTFDFFDPTTRSGRERFYYSSARFKIDRIFFYVRIVAGLPYLPVTWPVFTHLLVFLARRLCGIIWVEEVDLRALKPDPLMAPTA
jgi:SAM-dependent methyltransferase